ncbi:DUF2269 family protein [Cohnella zeiphila]|uniref:DUF2269 family protein n=1 Tax=Cohnella zeiphila TaxID=2761120 RepID=A0A7X0ST18_9BACL|nr:DUF2269 family protein [Cohnella zeiphila]MBB6734594.1 DUF2269 family protein [Cohnella zeiphila]
MYLYLLFIHILSAMVAIAAAIGYPLVMSGARTVGQARFGLGLQEKLAVLPKIGGTLLLLSGLAFGVQQTYLFRETWYWLSIACFLVILAIMAVLLPIGLKRQQQALLQQTQDDTLPDAYRRSRRQSFRLEGIALLFVAISLLLMVFKP